MLLRARFLNDVQGVNSFTPVESIEATAGSNFNVYFQLVDATQLPPSGGWVPPGLRYCPAATSTLVVKLAAVDQAYALQRFATQPFATLDASIWMVSFFPTDFPNGGTFSWSMTLTEPGPIITNGTSQFCLRVWPALPPPSW